MPIIGNPLNSVAFLTDSFNGNGSTTAFTMSVAPATSSSILVNITGVTQAPSTYSVVGTTLTFSTAPPSGTANISVRYLGIPASGVTTTAYRTLTEFTATASQTTFTPPSYTVGFIAVYQNGVMLGSTDYTATNGTTVVLAVGALVGDLISTESFYVSSVLNALPVTGGTISGNLVVTGTASITGVTTLTGGLNTPLAVTSGGTGVTTAIDYGFKNRIINGGMVIDQRNAAASQTFTAAGALAYSVDRWYGYCTGANVTGQQVAGATTPTVTQNRYRFTGAASVTAVGFGQRIEQKNSYDLAGATCTLSADLGISATLTTVTWTAYYATTTADTFGSLASPTVTSIATGTFTVGAAVANFSANISIPAAATTGIQILFTVGALTSGLTWTIGNVQLEKGSTATSFDYRPYGTELALCQRYFQTVGGTVNNFGIQGYQNAGQNVSSTVSFPVAMRAAPTGVMPTLSNTNTSGAIINSTSSSCFLMVAIATILGSVSSINLAAGSATFSSEL